MAHYGMASVTRRIDELYDRIAARRRPLAGVTEVLPPLPTPRAADAPSSLVGGA